jgi:hemerythrin superfamily protein
MNAVTLLEKQHRNVETLFQAYQGAEEPIDRRRLFLQLADAISAHTEVEERLFYPAVYFGEAQELLELALQDHQAIHQQLLDLLDTAPDSAAFDPRIRELEERVKLHIEEEEESLFPSVRTSFTLDELDALGMKMEEPQVEEEEGRESGASSGKNASESNAPKPNSEV